MGTFILWLMLLWNDSLSSEQQLNQSVGLCLFVFIIEFQIGNHIPDTGVRG